MVVGAKKINMQDLCKVIVNHKDIIAYAQSLVPRLIRCTEIVDNQRYYLATIVRKSKYFSYYTKKSICNTLLDGISITGIANDLVDFRDILMECDVDNLIRYYFSKELRDYKE